MKIIVIERTASKGGYQARVFGKNPPVHVFAKTEIEAIKKLAENLEKRNPKFIK